MSKKRSRQIAQEAKLKLQEELKEASPEEAKEIEEAINELEDVGEDLLGDDDDSELPSGDLPTVQDNLPDLGPAVPSEVGTQVVADMSGGIEIPHSETPQKTPEVEAQKEPGNVGSDGAGSMVSTELLGEHPVTGEPVRICDQ